MMQLCRKGTSSYPINSDNIELTIDEIKTKTRALVRIAGLTLKIFRLAVHWIILYFYYLSVDLSVR